MYTHPDLLGRLAKDHQRQLLQESESERLIKLTRMGRPDHSMRMRQRMSELLLSLGRSLQPRNAGLAQKSGA